MRFRFTIMCCAFGIILAAVLQAQEITRVAVLDYDVVFAEISRQSPEQQRISELKVEVSEQMELLQGELAELQENLRQAEDKRQSNLARRLWNEIKKRREYGRQYVTSKNEEIAALQELVAQPNRLGKMERALPDIISQVARMQGYSIILKKNSEGVIWLDASIDITGVVLEQLKKRFQEKGLDE